MTMVALILAIAAPNIANLLMARAARDGERWRCDSSGAGWLRVVRHLTKPCCWRALGGLFGLAFAAWGIERLQL